MSRLVRTARVTGIGLVTPLGTDTGGFFDALCGRALAQRRSDKLRGGGPPGVCRPPAEHPVDGIVEVAGFAPDIDPMRLLPPTEARGVDRFVLMAMAAGDAALADAGIVVGRDVDPARTAVVVGGGFGGLTLFEAHAVARHERGRTAVSPTLLAGMLPNMASARIAIRHGIRGFSSAVAAACASGAYAVAEALRLIREGLADVVLAGGAEAPLLPTAATAFRNARALAYGWADPAEASRPFDLRRNGFVLSEGAGVLVVERPEHAAARGRAGYAELAGWGVSTDAYHPMVPRADGAGVAESIRLALADADLEPADVDYVNAHATGTKLGDAAEARAIRAVFGADPPAVSSTKAVTGHLLAASGAVEAAATALTVHSGLIPPTHNLDEPDPECDLDHVRKAARQVPVRAALSGSFAFGGHNVSLLLTRTGGP